MSSIFIEQKQVPFPLAASVKKIRRVTPKLLQTVPTEDFPKFLAGAIIPKKFEGKHAVPSAERPSEPGSSSGGIRRLVGKIYLQDDRLSLARHLQDQNTSRGARHR